MSEVKRYGYLGIVEEEDGEVVKWEDFAAVKAERDALAAELSAVEVIHDECSFVTDDDYEACPEKVQKIIRNLAVMQIPATDAYLNSVRAEGIHFAANRILAAWKSCFIKASPAEAHDVSGAVLSALELLPNANADEFKRDYADQVRADIAELLRAGKDGE